jgi:hypothetical protein
MGEGASSDCGDAVSKGLENEKSVIAQLKGKDTVNYLAGAIAALRIRFPQRARKSPLLAKPLLKFAN